MYGFPTMIAQPGEEIDPAVRFAPAPFPGGDAAVDGARMPPPNSSLDSVLRFAPNAGPTLGGGAFGAGPFASNGFGLASIFSAFAALIQNVFALIAHSIGRVGPQPDAPPSQGCPQPISTNGCPRFRQE